MWTRNVVSGCLALLTQGCSLLRSVSDQPLTARLRFVYFIAYTGFTSVCTGFTVEYEGTDLAWLMEEWGVFSTGDASRATSLSRRQVLLLVEQGLIEPSLPSSGRGNARRFSYFDLVRCAIARDLGHLGMAPRFVKRILSQLPDSKLRGGPNETTGPIQIIVGDKGDILVKRGEEEGVDALAFAGKPTTTLAVDLNAVQQRLRRRLEEMH